MGRKVRYQDMQLYAITDWGKIDENKRLEAVEAALKGGATFLQLRDKEASHEDLVEEAKLIKPICQKYKVPFVINDDVMAALEADADGVHIGQSDMEYERAREILGENKIIGMTAKTVEQAVLAEKLGADYIGSGAVFHTSTKKDATDMTKETLLAITDSVNIPITAIGGIKLENCSYLKNTGVSGIAVVSAIFASDDIEEASRKLRQATDEIFQYARHDIVFDMDGTLLDSMPYWYNMGYEYVKKNAPSDLEIPENFQEKLYSMDLNESARYYRDVLKIDKSPTQIKEEGMQLMASHYENDIPMKPGMRRLILKEHEMGSRMCIFTSSDASYAESAMKRMGLDHCFDFYISSYDLGVSKRESKGYVEVAKKLTKSQDISHVYVYEDVLHGVKMAKEAGFHVVGVADADSAIYEEEIKKVADDFIEFA